MASVGPWEKNRLTVTCHFKSLIRVESKLKTYDMFIFLKSAHPRHYIPMFCFKKYMKVKESVIFNGHFGKLKIPKTSFYVVKNDK